MAAILASHFFSTLAMRKAIEQVDAGTVRNETPGGRYHKMLVALNASGGVLFIVGLVLAGIFVVANV